MQFYPVIFTDATNTTFDLQALNVGVGEDTTEGIAL